MAWVEDPTLGNALSQIFAGAARGPANYKLGVETRNLIEQQRAQQEFIDANRALSDLQAREPKPQYLPQGYEGPPMLPPMSEVEQFNRDLAERKRQTALAMTNLGARYATSAQDVSLGIPRVMGQSQVMTQGFPTSP